MSLINFLKFGTLKRKRLSSDNSAEDAETTASDVPVPAAKTREGV